MKENPLFVILLSRDNGDLSNNPRNLKKVHGYLRSKEDFI